MRAHGAALLLLASSCFTPWKHEGPWACSDGACPLDYACDEGVCCVKGGTPVCPTLPLGTLCPDGGTARLFFFDGDGDGEGNINETVLRCATPSGWVDNSTDCDDTNPLVNLRTEELCDGLDNNCDGVRDDGLPNNGPYYPDQDGDDYGTPDAGLAACASPPGYVTNDDDCAPDDPGRHPGAPELCNNIDDNCDGVRDDEMDGGFADTGDAFPCFTGEQGVCGTGSMHCAQGARMCRRANAPARELCDGLDNDCDGAVDERPDCGGPESFFSPHARITAKLALASSTGTACQTGYAGLPETVDGPVWTGRSGSNFHVLVVEPIDGGMWDMSRVDSTLRFDFTANSTTWGALNDSRDPGVYLCGEEPDELIRYVPSTDGLHDGQQTFSGAVPLRGGSGWTVGAGSGFDTTNTRSVEILVFNTSGAFTITFADAGFSP